MAVPAVLTELTSWRLCSTTLSGLISQSLIQPRFQIRLKLFPNRRAFPLRDYHGNISPANLWKPQKIQTRALGFFVGASQFPSPPRSHAMWVVYISSLALVIAVSFFLSSSNRDSKFAVFLDREISQVVSKYAMGGFNSKPSSSSQYSYNHSNSHNQNPNRAAPGEHNQCMKFGDDYNSLGQVTDALAHAGLESSNLIVGIDFTMSNEWTGKASFNGRSLHAIGDTPNPYEQALSIIGRTLSRFDEDNLIPCFGFGDATTHDQKVFSFYPDNRPCNGFEEALGRYREITPQLRLAGPTSFAPVIETAIGIVDGSGGQYHVLLIIADGQVTRSAGTSNGQLSAQERETINAIVKASHYPLSIVLVGVGDGPWDMMKQFDDNMPSRAFDNFQFVNFTEIMARPVPTSRKEAEFALLALMEIPLQFKATMHLQLLGKRRGFPHRSVLPPTEKNKQPYFTSSASKQTQSSSYHTENWTQKNASAPPQPQDRYLGDPQTCPVCWYQAKNLAFGCGHQTCSGCASKLKVCPLCQREITIRITLY